MGRSWFLALVLYPRVELLEIFVVLFEIKVVGWSSGVVVVREEEVGTMDEDMKAGAVAKVVEVAQLIAGVPRVEEAVMEEGVVWEEGVGMEVVAGKAEKVEWVVGVGMEEVDSLVQMNMLVEPVHNPVEPSEQPGSS